jgi:hypothetical protein
LGDGVCLVGGERLDLQAEAPYHATLRSLAHSESGQARQNFREVDAADVGDGKGSRDGVGAGLSEV